MNSKTSNEDLRTCLTHEPFHFSVPESPDVPGSPDVPESPDVLESPEVPEEPEIPEVPEESLTCSIDNYLGLVSRSSLSHQAAAIRRMQARRQKFSAFMPK